MTIFEILCSFVFRIGGSVVATFIVTLGIVWATDSVSQFLCYICERIKNKFKHINRH